MHLDLAAIDARKEVLAEIRSKREREQGEADEPGDQLAAVVQTKLEQTVVAGADGLEVALEAPLESHQGIALGRDRIWTAVRVVMSHMRLKHLLA